jgi:hypothetical protein
MDIKALGLVAATWGIFLAPAAVAQLNADSNFAKAPALPNGGSGAIGVAWGDFNNDGYPDLFLVPNVFPQGGRLFENNRDGTFTLVTAGAMASNTSGFGAAWADFKNSGNLDLIVGAANADYVYVGDGSGGFTESFTSGIGISPASQFYPAWADFDGDGFVDVFVANGFGASFGVAGPNSLFRNNGDGTFTAVTGSILSSDVASASQCAVWADYDNDGLPDLFVANARNFSNNSLQESFLYHNLGHGSFEKVTTGPLVTTLAGLNSAAWADYDNDGFLDLFVCGEGTGTVAQKRTLYHNDGKGGFAEATSAGSIDSDADFDEGCAWEDYDNDGYIDLVVSSGGSAGARNLSLYHNNGDGTFTEVTLGALVNSPGDGGGLAWADVNNDGFPDLFVANFQQWATAPNALWINKGNSNNWLTITCMGTVSNRAAIGAKVRVHATIGGKAMWQMRVIGTGAGYASQNELRAHFGLGDATVADEVRIEWPSGIVQTLSNVAVKQFLTVTESANLSPSINSSPSSQTVASGSTAVFSVQVTGSPAPAYQWSFNGAPLTNGGNVSGSGSSTLIITAATEVNAGNYSCTASNASGTIESKVAALTVIETSDPGRLVNISCRAMAGSGGNVLIAGFAIGGGSSSGTDTVLLRASGPALAPFGVAGALPDPQLELHDAGGLLATNDGWAGNEQVSSLASSVGAFAWGSPSSHDSALVESLSTGPYSTVIAGADGDTGIALAEVYDTTPSGAYTTASPRLINISARVQVGTGANVLIAGFVIAGSTSKTVLIRASGPALVPFGVQGVLPDPQLQLNDSTGIVAANLSWEGSPQIASEAASVGAFSWSDPASHDTALLVTLPPGPYTAQVSGASGDTGIALIEVYDVP